MILTMNIDLTESQYQTIQAVSDVNGLDQTELIHQAIIQWIEKQQVKNRRDRLRAARGLWKNRTDLPDFQKLRNEWNRELAHE